MPDLWEQWSENPAENNGPPPTAGAGEGRLNFDQISDTFRVLMAASKQLGKKFIPIGTDKTLGSMALQWKTKVEIQGGVIFEAVQISAVSLTSGLIDLARIPAVLTGKICDGLTTAATQTLYNWMYPIGGLRIWHMSNLAGLTWPGVTATWQLVTNSDGAILTVVGVNTPLGVTTATKQLGGSAHITSSDGGHDHDRTGGMELGPANLPTLNVTKTAFALDLGGADNVVTDVAYLNDTSDTHDHATITVDPHSHTVDLSLKRVGVYLVVRMT